MRTILYIFFSLLVGIVIVFSNTGCKKDLLLSNDALLFSVDTVLFDTVFTTVGSTTKSFKIYNPSSRPVVISSVQLSGGTNSFFRFNLDGVSGVSFTDIRIPGGDSLFGFVEVTLGENNATDPLIMEDSIMFKTNGKEQSLLLAAWGQDAYFYRNEKFPEGILPNDKPHVIYGYAFVDSAQTLTVQEGTNFHLHKNSLIIVYKGAIDIQGTVDNKVVVQGDRLEQFYKDVKGQYYGIYFQEARPSVINHAIIKNGTAGIHVFSQDENNPSYTLEVRNSEIYNHASYGIFNYSGGSIYGENLLVHNNNSYAFFQLEGGAYNFRQSHFLGYGTDGNQPALAIRNYFTRDDGITYIGEIPEGSFYNSVIYGSGENQIGYDTISQGGSVEINYSFINNLIKQENEMSSNSNFSDNIWNVNPEFKNINEKDFTYSASSILNNNGSPSFTTIKDILGNTRNPSTPDIGAYELH